MCCFRTPCVGFGPSSLSVDNLPHHSWEQCRYPVANGGMGYGNLEQIMDSAYAASFVASYSTLKKHFNIDQIITDDGMLNGVEIRSVEQFLRSFKVFHKVDPDTFPTPTALLDMRNKKGQSLQSVLTAAVVQYCFNDWRNSFVAQRVTPYGALLTSLQSPHAGRWLTAPPKAQEFRYTNLEFTVLLRKRLYMPQCQILPGTRCNCSGKKNVIVDVEGHQLAVPNKECALAHTIW